MDGPVLSIPVRPSRRLFATLVALHCAAALAPWASGVPPALQVAATLAALLGLARLRRAWVEERAGWILGVHGGAWTLAEGGRELAVEPLPDTVVWPWLVVLRLRSESGVRALVLCADSCDADALRRLRVALRMRAPLSPARAG